MAHTITFCPLQRCRYHWAIYVSSAATICVTFISVAHFSKVVTYVWAMHLHILIELYFIWEVYYTILFCKINMGPSLLTLIIYKDFLFGFRSYMWLLTLKILFLITYVLVDWRLVFNYIKYFNEKNKRYIYKTVEKT